MKKNKKTIYSWFLGEINNCQILFRFTYSWDVNKQVEIIDKINHINFYMALGKFNEMNKKKIKIDGFISY